MDIPKSGRFGVGMSREEFAKFNAERAAKQKVYRATVHLTIRAENKREAKRALESVQTIPYAADVDVDSTEGPEEAS